MKRIPHNLLRKVIKKDYSHLISLPLFWLQVVGLEASDYVELSMGNENPAHCKTTQKRRGGRKLDEKQQENFSLFCKEKR